MLENDLSGRLFDEITIFNRYIEISTLILILESGNLETIIFRQNSRIIYQS